MAQSDPFGELKTIDVSKPIEDHSSFDTRDSILVMLLSASGRVWRSIRHLRLPVHSLMLILELVAIATGVFWGVRWEMHACLPISSGNRLIIFREPEIIADHLGDLMSSRSPWLNAHKILVMLHLPAMVCMDIRPSS
jgi:hypothetical protein